VIGALLARQARRRVREHGYDLSLHVEPGVVVLPLAGRRHAEAGEDHLRLDARLGPRGVRGHQEVPAQLERVRPDGPSIATAPDVSRLSTQRHLLQEARAVAGRLQPLERELGRHVAGRDLVAPRRRGTPLEQVVRQELDVRAYGPTAHACKSPGERLVSSSAGWASAEA
jgi:hypothetical protein